MLLQLRVLKKPQQYSCFHTSTISLGQSLEKRREKALIKKAGGKTVKKKEETAAPTGKKIIKMKENEFFEKMQPVLFAQQNFDSFDISGLQESYKGLFDPKGEPILQYEFPLRVEQILENTCFRTEYAPIVKKSMHLHRVTSIVDAFLPRIRLSVVFNENEDRNERRPYYGNEIGPSLVAQAPKIYFPINPTLPELVQWTVICVGQDVRKEGEQYIHWIVSNMTNHAPEKSSSGMTFADYVAPSPEDGGDLHRYVFVLCSQKNKNITIAEKYDNDESRSKFNAREFLAKYELKEKGLAFFHSKWHPSVPGPHLRLDTSFFNVKKGSRNNRKSANAVEIQSE